MVVVSGRLEPELGALLTQRCRCRETLYQRARARDEAAGERGGRFRGNAHAGPPQPMPWPCSRSSLTTRSGPRASATRWWSTSTPSAGRSGSTGPLRLEDGARVSVETVPPACDGVGWYAPTTTTALAGDRCPDPDDSPRFCVERSTIGPWLPLSRLRRPLRAGHHSPPLAHGVRQRSRTLRSSAGGITGPCTRRVISRARARRGSAIPAARIADLCLRCGPAAVPEKPFEALRMAHESQGLRLNRVDGVCWLLGERLMWDGDRRLHRGSAIDAPSITEQDCDPASMSGGHSAQRSRPSPLRDADAPRLPARCRKPSPSQEPTGVESITELRSARPPDVPARAGRARSMCPRSSRDVGVMSTLDSS